MGTGDVELRHAHSRTTAPPGPGVRRLPVERTRRDLRRGLAPGQIIRFAPCRQVANHVVCPAPAETRKCVIPANQRGGVATPRHSLGHPVRVFEPTTHVRCSLESGFLILGGNCVVRIEITRAVDRYLRDPWHTRRCERSGRASGSRPPGCQVRCAATKTPNGAQQEPALQGIPWSRAG